MSDISDFLQTYNDALRNEIADADMPPELIERFIFDSCVKQQDGREVYFITRKSDGQRAVLRISDCESGENAATESAVLAKLDHPAIPNTLDVWEHNGRGFLAREYFDGDDLHTYIRKHGTLSRDMLTDITLRLCDVLSYLHGQTPAVIHRDIKPENIILSGKSDVKLIDFGIARDFRQETEKDTQVAGTRPYMAPEQFGSEQTDNRADLYSLGVVMIYMATGKTDKEGLKAVYPYKELTPIIERCIRKDRDQRFKTAARLKQRILWVQRKVTRKILICVGAVALCAGVIAAVTTAYNIAYDLGYAKGHEQGFESGVASIMDIPAVVNRPFTLEELNEPITFDSWYLDTAVRFAANLDFESPILRANILGVGEICIYGTYIIHPSFEVRLIKTHVGKGVVIYSTDDGYQPGRGDISSLADIPNMYYLTSLSLTSQSISDLSPLSGMKLERLNISDNFVGNLLPLKDMVTLRELDICQNPVRDLTPISRLLSLEHLDISHTQVTDLTPLAELTKLETLDLSYCYVEDISVLATLPNLREVDLSHTLVTDLSPLVRPGNPVTVRCVGLADEIVNAVRGMTGIIFVEEW